MKYELLTIVELHNLYVSKKVTPLDVVEYLIELIKKDKHNFMEANMFEEAIKLAKNIGEVEKDNLLWGIPFLIKDNIATKEVITSASSKILSNYISPFDATMIKKLKALKAIPLGKTTMDEFAMGGKGTTSHNGFTYNPLDKTKTKMMGGSSSGSAAAVTVPVVPFALASDTGDSIRKPASYGGIVGFKPSWGRISRHGLFSFAPSMDHAGYFTRSVFDAALLLEALAGYDENDPTSSTHVVDKYSKNTANSTPNYQIAVIKGIFDNILDEELKSLFSKSVEELKILGHKVEFVEMPITLLRAIFPTYFVISCAEASSNTACYDGVNFGVRLEGNTYEEIVTKTRSELFSAQIKKRILYGAYALSKDNKNETYLRAQRSRRKIVEFINKLFEKYDFIYLPAAPSVAPKFNEYNNDDNFAIADNHLAIANFGGYPSITIPLGKINGLPVGVNFTGRPFEESSVLNIAHQLEQILEKKGA